MVNVIWGYIYCNGAIIIYTTFVRPCVSQFTCIWLHIYYTILCTFTTFFCASLGFLTTIFGENIGLHNSWHVTKINVKNQCYVWRFVVVVVASLLHERHKPMNLYIKDLANWLIGLMYAVSALSTAMNLLGDHSVQIFSN